MASANHILEIANPALPLGSTILVVGANSYVGTHIVDQLLKLDYKVRGTVRSVKKNSWLDQFFARYGEHMFELVEVKDISGRGAIDECVKGAFYDHKNLL
jgi:nucleoside-diphosphate-sugar epimerase